VASDHFCRIEDSDPVLASFNIGFARPMHNPPLILIADDNETNRDILRPLLRSHGYELLEAADRQQALSIACQHHPDLILLDVMMPKVNGVEVCRRLDMMPICRLFRSPSQPQRSMPKMSWPAWRRALVDV